MTPAVIRPQPRRPRILLLLAALTLATSALAQPPAPQTPALLATLAEATTTRDAFITRLHAAGFTCPIPAPTILVEDVPSFGQYDDATNTLRTSDWSVLNPEERAAFLALAGPNATETDAHTLFDLASHRWILVHELGHWWQHCNGKMDDKNPYKLEFDADRVSLSYWREVDPTVVTRIMPVFHQVVTAFPDPTPAGQQLIPYFNAHYQQLGPTPAYRWYQSQMNVAAGDERPIPTFREILTQIKT